MGHDCLEAEKDESVNVVLQLFFLVLKIKKKINSVILKHTRKTELASTFTSGEHKQGTQVMRWEGKRLL